MTGTELGFPEPETHEAALIVVPETLAVAADGSVRTLQRSIYGELRRERFGHDGAVSWACRPWSIEPAPDAISAVVAEAIAYREVGIPMDEAFEWNRTFDMTPDLARELRRYRCMPRDYLELVLALWTRGARMAGGGRSARDEATRWLTADIPAWRCVRYAAAGLTVEEAVGQERDRASGIDVDSAVDVLLALTESGRQVTWHQSAARRSAQIVPVSLGRHAAEDSLPASGCYLLQPTHSLYVASVGPERDFQRDVFTGLRARALSAWDAMNWACRDWASQNAFPWDEQVAAVVDYGVALRDLGIPASEGYGWMSQRFSISEATRLRGLGWSPECCAALQRILFGTTWLPTLRDPVRSPVMEQWLMSGIPAWRAVWYAQAGLDASEANAQEVARAQGREAAQAIDASVDLLIALRGGSHVGLF